VDTLKTGGAIVLAGKPWSARIFREDKNGFAENPALGDAETEVTAA
jgi:hypothetical protein